MMRHGCLLIERRLRGADVHTSVDLHGVSRNQFDAIIDGSDCHGERRLASSGGTNDGQWDIGNTHEM